MLRFGNGIFEPLWNRTAIDHVQITVAEDIGIGHRAGYYDRAGALRDVIQNHALQLLSLVAMEPPASFDADLVRDEKAKALHAVRAARPGEVDAVRGQYTAGWLGGERVPGYREEEDVPADSRTETYAALRVEIDNWRWAGVPFYLRTGKRLPLRMTEIAIAFKPAPHQPFRGLDAPPPPNELVHIGAAERGRDPADRGEDAGDGAADAAGADGLPVRHVVPARVAGGVRAAAARRAARRRDAVHARRRGRGGVADRRPGAGGVGRTRRRRAGAVRGRHARPALRRRAARADGRAWRPL